MPTVTVPQSICYRLMTSLHLRGKASPAPAAASREAAAWCCRTESVYMIAGGLSIALSVCCCWHLWLRSWLVRLLQRNEMRFWQPLATAAEAHVAP